MMHLPYLARVVFRWWLRRRNVFREVALGKVGRSPASLFHRINAAGIPLMGFHSLVVVEFSWVQRVETAFAKRGIFFNKVGLCFVSDTYKTAFLDALKKIRSSDRVAFKEIGNMTIWKDGREDRE